jgi:hypothetical protein
MAGRETALLRAQKIREVLLDHGVPEVSIELQDGRPAPGDTWNSLDPVSVFSHHIASYPSPANPTPGLNVVKQGRPDLGGPLANGTAGVDLVYRILCLGWANHPGYGGPLVVSGPLGSFRIPVDNARPYAWGTEYEGGYTDAVWDETYTNRRTGKRMTFREFMGRCNAGLVEAIWLPGVSSRGRYDQITPGMDLSGYHGEHLTWAPGRKFDRRNYTTTSGRLELRRFADAASTTTTPLETIMAWYESKADFERSIADAVLARDRVTTPATGFTDAERRENPTLSVDRALELILGRVFAAVQEAADDPNLAGVKDSLDRLTRLVRASKVDQTALAAAVAEQIPAREVNQATVEAALRTVLTEGVG